MPNPTPPHPVRTLHYDVLGEGPRVVLAHGFTQTRRVWGSLDRDLAHDHQVVAVDLPGHGDSAGVPATLVDGALLLARVGGPAAYLGYSMGARFCLHLALACPEVVHALVLISGTAGIEDPEERRARQASDAALAEQLDPGPGGGPVPIEAFLALAGEPLFAGVDPGAVGFAER